MQQLVGSTSLYVEKKGASDLSLVFLHYWGGTHRTWNKVVAELAGSHRTITYDMRGWGQSDRVSEIDVRIAPKMGRLRRGILVRLAGEQAFSSL
jgi:pimeloyl-ACP methyl ester carboxylesterase